MMNIVLDIRLVIISSVVYTLLLYIIIVYEYYLLCYIQILKLYTLFILNGHILSISNNNYVGNIIKCNRCQNKSNIGMNNCPRISIIQSL